METKLECLSCGHQRVVEGGPGECPRCGYVGWAPTDDLSEALRRRLRSRAVSFRRIPGRQHRKAS